MAKKTFVVEAFVNTITEDGAVLLRKRGLKDGPTLRVKLDNFSAFPDIAKHDGVSFSFDSDCEIRLSDDHSYCKFDGAVKVIEVVVGAGKPAGVKITGDEAMSILSPTVES